jgi:hypothetical protein
VKRESKAGPHHPLSDGHIAASDGKLPGPLKVKPHQVWNVLTLAKTSFVKGWDQGLELVLIRNKIWSSTTDMTAIRIRARRHSKKIGKVFEGGR